MAARALVVFGGNGFVGSAVCAAAVRRNVPVIAVSRSGARPPQLKGGSGCWSDSVRWERGDASDPTTYAQLLTEAAAVVVSVGSPPLPFVDFARQRAMNGATNTAIARAAREAGVPALVVVNASMPAWLDSVAGGYAQGKRDAAEGAVAFASGRPDARAAILKPSAIYGTRYEMTRFGAMPIPLGLVLAPASALLQAFRGLTAAARRALPYAFDGVLLPPVPVGAVAEAAVHYALDAPAACAGGSGDGVATVVEAEALLSFAGAGSRD